MSKDSIELALLILEAEKAGITTDQRERLATLTNARKDVRRTLQDKLPEEEKVKAIQALAAHGITDRQSLVVFGSGKFANADFPPFGKGKAFAAKILGETVYYLKLQDLERIADAIGFSKNIEPEKKQQYLAALASHGITDRHSFHKLSLRQLKNTDFPPFGKGNAFATKILGETVYSLTLAHLESIADILNLPQLSETTKLQYMAALASHGITDRQSLLTFGTHKFTNTDFPPFGKGNAFASEILGEYAKPFKLAHLERIADILNFPQLSETTKQQYMTALASQGITDRQLLLTFGSHKFGDTDFPPFGKGYAFASAVLGETIIHTTYKIRERIADTIGFPKVPESDNKQQYLNALAYRGITDRQSLHTLGVSKFKNTDFPPFGKGNAFAGKILGEYGELKLSDIDRIGDILNLPQLSETTKLQYMAALASHGITDRQSLHTLGISQFLNTDFPPFGKGHAFASAVLGKSIHQLKVDHLKLIADILFGKSEK
jgi:protoheme ferro-lyase